mgnify:CR=1 FL=1
MGLPATTEVAVELTLESPPSDTVLKQIDGYLESALQRRPDLAAARALAARSRAHATNCLLYTSDAADERSRVDLRGRRIIKKKKKRSHTTLCIR